MKQLTLIIATLLMLAQSARGEGNAVADTARHLAPTATIAESQVTGLAADLAAKAPAFTAQSANTVYAGPSTGAAAAPGFRALVAADIPSLSSVYLPLAGGTLSGDLNLGTHTLLGDTASGGNLLLSSTSNATKGKIYFGATAGNNYFDEVNGYLALGKSGAGRTIDATGDMRLWAGSTFMEVAASTIGTSNPVIRLFNASNLFAVDGFGNVTAASFTGTGSGLTSLNGSNIASGTVAAARLAAIAESGVTNLVSDLALKSPLASPTFTGTPAAPTAAGGTNTTQIATTAFVLAAIPTIDSLLPSQTGNSGKFLTTNGTAASWATVTQPTAANPTASLGLTAANGSAATFMRSDAAPALDQTISPTWTNSHTFTGSIIGGTSGLTLRSGAATATILLKSTASSGVFFDVQDSNGNVYLRTDNNQTYIRGNIVDYSSSGGLFNVQNGSGRIIVGPSGTLEFRASSGGSIDTALVRASAGVARVATSNAGTTLATISTGGFQSAITTTAKTANYTATLADHTIAGDASGGAFNITLPTAVGITGQEYVIKNVGASGTVTVTTTSSQTIDGSTTDALAAQYKYVRVQSNNANWIIVGNN